MQVRDVAHIKILRASMTLSPIYKETFIVVLRSALTKLRSYSHRFMVERGRWMKPKVQYIDRKCTLCNDNDIRGGLDLPPHRPTGGVPLAQPCIFL